MLREFKVDANVGRPQVAYRETIRERRREGRGPLRPPDRRLAASTARLHQHRAGARRGLRLRQQDQGRLDPDRVHPGRSRRASRRRSRPASRPATRWSTSASTLDRRQVPRRRLLGDGLQDRRLDGAPGGGPAGQAGPARAGDGGRGRHARGVHGRRDRRPQPPPRPRRGHGAARQRARWSRPTCRWARCSATRPTCARSTQGRATYTMQFDALRGGAAEHRRGDRRGAAPASRSAARDRSR